MPQRAPPYYLRERATAVARKGGSQSWRERARALQTTVIVCPHQQQPGVVFILSKGVLWWWSFSSKPRSRHTSPLLRVRTFQRGVLLQPRLLCSDPLLSNDCGNFDGQSSRPRSGACVYPPISRKANRATIPRYVQCCTDAQMRDEINTQGNKCCWFSS